MFDYRVCMLFQCIVLYSVWRPYNYWVWTLKLDQRQTTILWQCACRLGTSFRHLKPQWLLSSAHSHMTFHSYMHARGTSVRVEYNKWVCFGLLPTQLPDNYVRRNSRRNALLGGALLNDPVNLLYKPRTGEVSSNIQQLVSKYMASVRTARML